MNDERLPDICLQPDQGRIGNVVLPRNISFGIQGGAPGPFYWVAGKGWMLDGPFTETFTVHAVITWDGEIHSDASNRVLPHAYISERLIQMLTYGRDISEDDRDLIEKACRKTFRDKRGLKPGPGRPPTPESELISYMVDRDSLDTVAYPTVELRVQAMINRHPELNVHSASGVYARLRKARRAQALVADSADTPALPQTPGVTNEGECDSKSHAQSCFIAG